VECGIAHVKVVHGSLLLHLLNDLTVPLPLPITSAPPGYGDIMPFPLES